MKQTRGAIGNLINRYRAVLKKCHLLNSFGSLALAGMLVLGGATVSVAANVTIDSLEKATTGRYAGEYQDTLTFAQPESFRFSAVATGFGTIHVKDGVTATIANLCTGYVGDGSSGTEGGGFWGNIQNNDDHKTFTVTGGGTLIAEHVSINTGQTIAVSGNLTLVNISDGIISELEIQDGGNLIVKKGGSLDVTGATKVEITDKNFKIEDGGTLKIKPDSLFIVNGDIGSIDDASGIIIADKSTLRVTKNDNSTGNINIKQLEVNNNGAVQANDSITVSSSINNANGSISAKNNINVGSNDISKADNAQLTLNAGDTITANNIDATHVAAQTLKAQKATVDEGTLSLTGSNGTASEVGNLSLTNGTKADIQGTLNLEGTDSILAVGSTSDTVGGTTLAAQNVNLKGGMILVDPAWGKASSNVAVADLGNSTGGAEDIVSLGGKIGVGQNSYMAIGTTDITWLRGVVGKLSKDGTQAALGLFRPITIESGNGLVVNGTLTGVTDDSQLHKEVSGATDKAVFASNTLLVVNGQAINGDKAAITFETSGTVDVADGAKLLVTNAVSGQTYTIAANVNQATLEGWKKYTTTDMLSLSDATWESNKVIVTVTRNEASKVFPDLSGELVGTVNALYAGTPNVHSTDQGIRFLSRATDNEFLGLDKRAAVEQMESASRIAFAAAVPQMTKMASDAATNAVVNRLGLANPENGAKAMNVDGKLVDDKALGLALWIAPLWSNQTGFGMEAGNLDYGYSANIGGISLGADYTWANNIRAGLMFNIGSGYAESSGDLSETTNSMTFWGLGAYGGWEYENFAVMADVSYTSTWNSVNQDVDSRMKMSDLEADIQASAISAGLRFEYKLETQYLDLIPHVGARYMSINIWGYDVDNNEGTVLEGDGFQQNIWTFPVGITFSKELEMNSDWYFKPSIDFTVIPAAGDIKAKQDVRFGNLPSTEMETQMMDYFTWQGGVGLEFGNDNMSVGVNYTLQAGQNSTGHGVFGMFRYEF